MNTNEAAKNIHPEVIRWRRDLHRIPEIGFELHQTSKYIRDRLDEMGIKYRTAAQTGIVGLVEGKKPGPTLALRADMDALPLAEDTGLSFASTNGNMHACGHDAHMAMLLGAAKIINNMQEDIRGRVKLLFQPGEEGHGGAAKMIEDGCLENPRVDALVGLHVGQIFPEVKCGQIGICAGPILASATRYRVTVRGKSTHGALPHLGVDAITAASEIILALQKIISRETDPLRPAVLTVGKIRGGEAFNIVTSEVTFCGDFRTLGEEDRQFVTGRLKDISGNVAAANRAEAVVEILGGYPSTVNDPALAAHLEKIFARVVGPGHVIEIKKPNMGTEDMSFYFEKVPGALFMLGTGNPSKGIVYPHHNSRFDLDEDCLWVGPAVFACLALDFPGWDIKAVED